MTWVKLEVVRPKSRLDLFHVGRLESGEQNTSMQSLIQIALTLEVEIDEMFPPLRELKTPYRKKLERTE